MVYTPAIRSGRWSVIIGNSMNTDEKILLANKKAQELLTVLGSPGPASQRLPTPADQLLDLLDCAIVFAKYNLLDLEATRREREFFRNQSSNQG